METISITFKASDIGEVTLENISCVEYGTSENNLKKVEGAALATHRFEMGYNLYHIIGIGIVKYVQICVFLENSLTSTPICAII